MAVSPKSILKDEEKKTVEESKSEVENDDEIFLSAVESDSLNLGPEKKVYQTIAGDTDRTIPVILEQDRNIRALLKMY